MSAPPLPHTPSNSHFVRRVKLRLAYRLAFVSETTPSLSACFRNKDMIKTDKENTLKPQPGLCFIRGTAAVSHGRLCESCIFLFLLSCCTSGIPEGWFPLDSTCFHSTAIVAHHCVTRVLRPSMSILDSWNVTVSGLSRRVMMGSLTTVKGCEKSTWSTDVNSGCSMERSSR